MNNKCPLCNNKVIRFFGCSICTNIDCFWSEYKGDVVKKQEKLKDEDFLKSLPISVLKILIIPGITFLVLTGVLNTGIFAKSTELQNYNNEIKQYMSENYVTKDSFTLLTADISNIKTDVRALLVNSRK